MESLSKLKIQQFSQCLLAWHQSSNQRSMPWKGINNPYYIWLSEIILQQTRVEQGLAYYERFIRLFPTLKDLAEADEQLVFNAWQGLGYYSRCRNLMKTAQIIQQAHQGCFPNTYEALRTLPGIGDYTAAAIASFAFKKPHAAVDGNVIRILSRYFALAVDPHTQVGKRQFNTLANLLLPPKEPHLFNQAMMDLGATVCTPKQTKCGICPLQKGCVAQKRGEVDAFPIKKKKNPLKIRHLHFAVFSKPNHLVIIRRTGKDIWSDLHTPWHIESANDHVKWPVNKAFQGKTPKPIVMHQVLSHQKIMGYFYSFPDPGKPFMDENGLKWIPINSLKSLAFPRMVLVFLKNAGYL